MTAKELVQKYLGASFGSGASGCFLFVKKVYKDEFDIDIQTDYMEMLSKFVPIKEPRFGDIVLVRNHPIVINHIGIALDPEQFIHCVSKVGVIVSKFSDLRISNRIAGFLRHPKRMGME